MSDTPYSICSSALTEVGCNPISSFDDGTTESIVSGNNYERKITNALTSYPWNFAKAQSVLDLLADVPLEKWAHFYQLPSDLLLLRTVIAGGDPIVYDRYEDRIATDYNGTVVAEYTFRAPEVLLPPYFINAFTTELAAFFARSIRRDEAEGKRLDDLVNGTIGKPGLWAKAKNLDSQQQSARKLRPSRLLAVRGSRGFGAKGA